MKVPNQNAFNNSLLVSACCYASMGWQILPLVPSKKHPLTKNGFYDATSSENKITEWFDRWPKANIGIRTGSESCIFVLDIDVKGGIPGFESLVQLESEYRPLPNTLKSTTPSRGQHLYFKHPGGKIKNRTSFRPGLDLRGDGGYIVAPPSSIDGKKYEWVDSSLEIAEAPEWLLDILKSKTKSSGDDSSTGTPIVRGVHGAPEGQRNDSIFKFASSLRARNCPRDEAEILILTKARDCDPPYSENKALVCLESAYSRYEPSQMLNMTEVGNAERLIERYGDRIRYIPDYNRWLIWECKDVENR